MEPVESTGLRAVHIAGGHLRFDPQMTALRTALLREERFEIAGLTLAAGPVLHALVEDRHTTVVHTDRLVGARIVGSLAAGVLAHRTGDQHFVCSEGEIGS